MLLQKKRVHYWPTFSLYSVFMLQLKNLKNPYLQKSDFSVMLNIFKAKLNEELIHQYISACTDNKMLNVHLMANHYLNRHPFMPQALKSWK